MKIFSKLPAAAMIAVALSLSLASCHDHDEVCSDASSETVTSNNELTKEALDRILYITTDVENIPDNWENSNYTVSPTYGTVVDASSPHVRYVEAGSRKEALETYLDLTEQEEDSYSASWSRDSIGSITLISDSTATCYGRILMNVKQIPELEEIRFVPNEAMGTNANNSWKPRYRFGDVLKIYPNGKEQNAEYWLCVRGEYHNDDLKGTHEHSYWVCFTLADENIEQVNKAGYKLVAPIELNGDKTYLCHLPQLLQIICNPHTAWLNWNDVASDAGLFPKYEKYGFLGSLYTKGYYNENDFVNISENVKHNVGLEKLIPALTNRASLSSDLGNGKPLTLLCHGRTYPFGYHNFNPIKFKKTLTYSNVFFHDEKEFDYNLDVDQQGKSLNILDLVNNPVPDDVFKFTITDSKSSAPCNYLIVRMKRSDKLPGIKTGTNKGELFQSKTHTYVHYPAVHHNDEGASQGLQVPSDSRFIPCDKVQLSDGNEYYCISAQVNKNEMFYRETNRHTDNNLSAQDAFNVLLNVLNGLVYDEKKDGVPVDYLKKAENNYKGINWIGYLDITDAIRVKLNTDGALEDKFNYSKDNGSFSVKMNFTDSSKETKCLKLTYNSTTGKYSCSVEDALRTQFFSIVCPISEGTSRSNITRLFNYGNSILERNNNDNDVKAAYDIIADGTEGYSNLKDDE